MNVLSPFDETVRDLTLAQHLPRIKKLLVYACTHHWESDALGLSSYHLHDLVQQLVQIAPTFSALKSHLNVVIQTLNKPAEYTLVANTIVKHLQPLYPDAVTHSSDQYQALYRIAAQQLEQDDDVNRMKKLIHFVCRDQWTHDLDTVELYELIEELHGLTPTAGELTAVLDSVVQTISKPDKYRAIAQKISNGIAPLYSSTTHALMHPEPNPSPVELPQPHVNGNALQPQPNQQIPQSSDKREANEVETVSDGSTELVEAAPTAKSSILPSRARSAKAKAKPLSMRKKVASLPADDLFTLRNEIHKFTNPLLAKYLLFMNSYSAAVKSQETEHPGRWNIMVWDALKNTDLDTLLCDGLKVCRNLGEFERSLKRTARKLKSAKQYSGVINAIVRAVQPMFADCREEVDIVYPSVREESQGTPTYSKRRSLDARPSQPLSSQLDASLSGQGVPPHSYVQSYAGTAQGEALSRSQASPLSEQETSIEGGPSPAPAREPSHASSPNRRGKRMSDLPTSGLEPTESDAYLEDTETELPSHADLSDAPPADQIPIPNAEQGFIQNDIQREQHMDRQLDKPMGNDDDTAYLMPSNLPSHHTSDAAQPTLVEGNVGSSPMATPSPTLDNRAIQEGRKPSIEHPKDETLFLPAP